MKRGDLWLMLEAGRYALTVNAEGFQPASPTQTPPRRSARRAPTPPAPAGKEATDDVLALAGYQVPAITSATKTPRRCATCRNRSPSSPRKLMQDQLMTSIGDVVRYVPGITAHQGENNRDQVIIRGNNSSADFFLNGVRDDVQYYRDLYNLERVEALKGPNAMIFGRGGGGGVINRVTKEAGFQPLREITLQGGAYGNKRVTADLDQPLTDRVAFRLNGMYENSDSFRQAVNLERYGINPTLTIAPDARTKITLGYEHLHDTPRGRPRHPVVSGAARRRRRGRPTTAIRTTAT